MRTAETSSTMASSTTEGSVTKNCKHPRTYTNGAGATYCSDCYRLVDVRIEE